MPLLLVYWLFAILQKYDFSSKSQLKNNKDASIVVVCDTAKVRFFKQITTAASAFATEIQLFAILQKYDFSSKSQHSCPLNYFDKGCLRYCKSTIFQANHNCKIKKVGSHQLFAILQKYDFSSKSQHVLITSCVLLVVCDTAKVRFFKQITT